MLNNRLVIFLCLNIGFVAPVFSAWHARSPHPFSSPNIYSASLDQACRAAGSYLFSAAAAAGAPYRQYDSWSYIGSTNTNTANLRACRYETIWEDNSGVVHVDGAVIYASFATSNSGGGSSNNTCNPVNIGTGNKFYKINDVNSFLKINRYYNSTSLSWSFDYLQRLHIDPDVGFAIAQRADGERYYFSINESGYAGYNKRSARLIKINDGYEFKSNGNRIELYDSVGRLKEVNEGGVKTRITYEDNQVVVTKNGKELTFNLENSAFVDGKVNVKSISQGQVVLAEYKYSKYQHYDRLDSVVYPDGTGMSYVYEDERFPAQITGVINEEGSRISSVQYNEQGQVSSSELGTLNSGVERTEFIYDDIYTRTVTNSLRKKATYKFTVLDGEYKLSRVEGHASEHCIAAVKSNQYYTSGPSKWLLKTKTDWSGNTTYYEYNEQGQESLRIEAYNTPLSKSIKTEWHPDFNLPTEISSPEQDVSMKYDSNGRLLSRSIRVKVP